MPAVSLTVNTELASAAEQVKVTPDVLGAVTAQALAAPSVESKAMPAPDSVILIPALAAAVMVCVGVNEIVAVVAVALTVEASVIARPLTPEIKGNAPVAVVSMTTGLPGDKSLEVPAATLAKAACPLVGLVNFVMVKVMATPPV